MARMTGAQVLAKALKTEGLDALFGVPGGPMFPIVAACKGLGIRVYNFRHEQAAAMAAQAYSYVTRRAGVAMTPTGPAMSNAITGLVTAWANCWPILLISGSAEASKRHRGDFQETPQVELARPVCKWSAAVENPRQIPYFVNSAVHRMMAGRPGPVYLDVPANVIAEGVDEGEVQFLPPAPSPARPLADPWSVREAIRLISEAERPLLLMGKGVAWSDAADEARALLDRLQIPFVPSPMGKGVIPDDHPLSAAGARTFALQNADLIVLAGARLNWIFHFGEPPRFAPNVKLIQLDIEASEIGNGVHAAVGLVGDAKAVLGQMLDEIGNTQRPVETPWLQAIESERRRNAHSIAAMVGSERAPMNMYRMYRDIVQVLDRDATVCVDGEDTMAVSRAMVPNYVPRHRLDAGASGCMGVSVPYAIGAQIARPGKQVISINGDYAFGWNGMEIEAALRYNLPIVFLVANNVTVGGPQRCEMGERSIELAGQPEGLRYDRLMEAFGGHGEHVESPQQLRPALERAFSAGKASLINVVIDKRKGRKQQAFGWLTR